MPKNLTQIVEQKLLDEATTEMQELKQALDLNLDAVSTIRLIGLLQLASRHPALPPNSARFCQLFVSDLAKLFDHSPACQRLIQLGWHR